MIWLGFGDAGDGVMGLGAMSGMEAEGGGGVGFG